MDNLFASIPAVLLVLACPLMMVGMGAGAWFVARLRGEKRELSLGCMPHHSTQEQHASEGNGATAGSAGERMSETRPSSVGSL